MFSFEILQRRKPQYDGSWRTAATSCGKQYYYNIDTRASTFTRPPTMGTRPRQPRGVSASAPVPVSAVKTADNMYDMYVYIDPTRPAQAKLAMVKGDYSEEFL